MAEVESLPSEKSFEKLSLVILEEHRNKEKINFDGAQVKLIMRQRLNSEWRLQVTNVDKKSKSSMMIS